MARMPTPNEPAAIPDQSTVVHGAASIEETARRLSANKHPWLIDPRTSKRIGYWDGCTSIALIFTALVTPFEVSLLKPRLNVLFFVNRVVDAIFSIDILIQFILIKEKHSDQASHGVVWVTDPCALAYGYMTSWFALDVFSVAVSALDVITVAFSESADLLEGLVALKVLRVLRLFKLMRLFRSSRIAKRWETRIAVDYGLLSIIKSFIGVVVSSH